MITTSLFLKPDRIVHSAWIGHIPFAFWVIEAVKPAVFVELGTHSGASYFAFCQSVESNRLPTTCYAVDTWDGDEHAGFYNDTVYADVAAYNEIHYYRFSRLLRMTFDNALLHFSNHSIDLLHIDGLHTYEAVKNDFESWLPKLSDQGVVLFHDINVKERNFGVWRFWEEISKQYPHVAFDHSAGLGVLLVGSEQNPAITEIANNFHNPSEQHLIKSTFARLGEMAGIEHNLSLAVTERDEQIRALHAKLQQQQQQQEQESSTQNEKISELEKRLKKMENSSSWRITKPIRKLTNSIRKRSRKIRKIFQRQPNDTYDYQQWIAQFDTLNTTRLALIKNEIQVMSYPPTI